MKKNINNKDKLDITRHSSLTRELIRRKFITESDFDIYRYDKLFDELLNQYDYKIVLIATSYSVSHIKSKQFKDEDGYNLEYLFAYFKTALINNINKLTIPIEIDWLD